MAEIKTYGFLIETEVQRIKKCMEKENRFFGIDEDKK